MVANRWSEPEHVPFWKYGTCEQSWRDCNCGNPLAGRSCLVLVKACLGARCEAKQQVKRRVQPWRGSGVIMTIRTNPLPQPNPSRVRYMGECFSIPTLSLSEAERRVYHNHAPPGRVALSSLRHDRASDSLHKFISDTAALQVDEIRRFYYALCISRNPAGVCTISITPAARRRATIFSAVAVEI